MPIGAIDGLISGLSTSDIVSKIMAAERLRLTSLEDKKKALQTRSDALRDINTRLSSLQSAAGKLALRGTMLGRVGSLNTPPTSNPSISIAVSADASIGSFTVRADRLATASVARSTGAAGASVVATDLLNDTNTAVAVTSGTFTINGTQFTLDVTADTLTDVIGRVNAAAGTTGVTAALVADADGRAANRFQLSSAGTISLGSASDSSNLLAAMKVLGVPQSGGTITGQGAVGGVRANELLQNADVATALAGSGSFTINGVEIGYNAAVDTLNDVISRINSSDAGVTASYDAVDDRLRLTSNATGDLNITLAEGATGNFLTAFKLIGGSPVTLGTTARYSLDGGATWLYSTANTITNAVPGVTVTLLETSATDTTVTVNASTNAAVAAVKGFVDAFNNAVELIEEKTAVKDAAGKAPALAGDSSIRGIANSLRSLVAGRGLGLSGAYTALQDVGVTTGAVGSAVGTTRKLTLDESKLRAALEANPSSVFDLFSATSQVALTTPGDVTRVGGTPTSKVSGVYSVTSNGAGLLAGTFTPTGGAAQALTGDGTITAGGLNTTLIPGLTLTGASPFTGATTTVTVTARAGVAAGIADYLKRLTEASGTIDARQDSIDSQRNDLTTRIERTQERLDAREAALYAQFKRLEVVLAKMQSQSSQLSSGLASLNRQ